MPRSISSADEETLCGERVIAFGPDRAGPYGERRPQKHRRLRVLSEAQKKGSQVKAKVSALG